MAIARPREKMLSIGRSSDTRASYDSSPHRLDLAVGLACLALLSAILGCPAKLSAQGVAGISLGNIALPTVVAAPAPPVRLLSSIYVANPTANSLSVLPIGSSGNATSLFTQTQLSSPMGIAYSGGYLYVVNRATDSITVYSATANGPANPTTVISGGSTQLYDPVAIAVDSTGKIYVANDGSINGNTDSVTIYAAGSSGNAVPIATISGGNTGVVLPSALTLDSQGNIYVVNKGSDAGGQDSITIFSSGSTGSVTPARTISGSSTALVAPAGIAVDPNGYIYVSSAVGTNDISILSTTGVYAASSGSDDTNAVSILIFAPGANGNVAPTTSIDGDFAILTAPGALTFASGQLYVTNPASLVTGDESVVVYKNTDFGVTARLPQGTPPAALVFGPSAGLNQPFGIAVDPSGNMYVTNSESNSITVFSPGAGQNTPPSAVITSPSAIVNPTAVAVGSGGTLYVANAGVQNGSPDSVTVYPPATYGTSAPSQTIGGIGPSDLSSLSDPSAIAVGDSRLFVANETGGYQMDGSINIYQLGSGVPSWGISGTATSDQTGLNDPVAVALDTSNNVYVLNANGGPDNLGSITVYTLPTGKIWNVAPTATIANISKLGPGTQFDSPAGMTLDSSNKIYVTNDGSIAGRADSVTIYAAGSTGDVAPSAVISGSNTGLNMPQGIALDTNGYIYVANDGSTNGGIDSITVYSAGSSGNVAPVRTISGSLTGLTGPAGLAVY